METLKDYLLTQDMGEKCANKICDAVLNDTFDANSDPISAIIINAFKNNLYTKYPLFESDFDAFEMDLDYAINQLKKVKQFVNEVANKYQ
jgi:hypothetical protein